MDKRKTVDNQGKKQWEKFIRDEALTEHQAWQFERYISLLQEWNKKINLTRIIDTSDIIAYHFLDSLQVKKVIDFTLIKSIADVGAGAGFPGLPLKIKFPHVLLVLIEVNTKKIAFLEHVIQELNLSDCFVCPLDWRTFLRQVPYPVDLFVARASLKPDELIRMFKPDCAYKDAQLIYWASTKWQPEKLEAPYVARREHYTINAEKRDYVFFKL